ncbi:MAG TPA: OpgC domain-containing protein [Stellaceae bacterium]|nr:OpgC domain-containing protein [Stellaceae bacterium]
MPSSLRDLRLDFFRGLALIFIFIDHIPGNFLSHFTLQEVQFCDAAEVFFFISGFTAALVYGRVLATQGRLRATALVLRRAWQLYVAHVFLFMMFMAEVSYIATAFNNPMYTEEIRAASFLQEPHIAIVKALLLQFQPAFLDILPLYIVLLLALPAILLGVRKHPLLVLVPSFLLYLAVQITELAVPAYPPGRVWYFNPLAWQFLFTTGVVLGHGAVSGRDWHRSDRALVPLAVLVFFASFVVRISWSLHGVWEQIPALFVGILWPVDKGDLAPIRVVSFLALVVLVAAMVRPQAAWLQTRPARPLLSCGRQSLEIFCLGILLSALAHFVLSEYDAGIGMQLAVNLAGILAMFLTAAMMDWYKSMGRAPTVARAESARSGGAGG